MPPVSFPIARLQRCQLATAAVQDVCAVVYKPGSGGEHISNWLGVWRREKEGKGRPSFLLHQLHIFLFLHRRPYCGKCGATKWVKQLMLNFCNKNNSFSTLCPSVLGMLMKATVDIIPVEVRENATSFCVNLSRRKNSLGCRFEEV